MRQTPTRRLGTTGSRSWSWWPAKIKTEDVRSRCRAGADSDSRCSTAGRTCSAVNASRYCRDCDCGTNPEAAAQVLATCANSRKRGSGRLPHIISPTHKQGSAARAEATRATRPFDAASKVARLRRHHDLPVAAKRNHRRTCKGSTMSAARVGSTEIICGAAANASLFMPVLMTLQQSVRISRSALAPGFAATADIQKSPRTHWSRIAPTC